MSTKFFHQIYAKWAESLNKEDKKHWNNWIKKQIETPNIEYSELTWWTTKHMAPVEVLNTLQGCFHDKVQNPELNPSSHWNKLLKKWNKLAAWNQVSYPSKGSNISHLGKRKIIFQKDLGMGRVKLLFALPVSLSAILFIGAQVSGRSFRHAVMM